MLCAALLRDLPAAGFAAIGCQPAGVLVYVPLVSLHCCMLCPCPELPHGPHSVGAFSQQLNSTSLHFKPTPLSLRSPQGMLRSAVVGEFYQDLVNPDYETAFAIYHRRFSTNTTPKWPLAQPMRVLGHNGEQQGLRSSGGSCASSRGAVAARAAADVALRAAAAAAGVGRFVAAAGGCAEITRCEQAIHWSNQQCFKPEVSDPRPLHPPFEQVRSTPCRATSTGWPPASRS